MKIIKKLKSRRGETMVEMLVSLMILTLTICLLVTMVMVSYQFDRQAREADVKYKADLAVAENFTGTPSTGTITLKPKDFPADDQDVQVDIYSNADSDLKSYKLKPGP